MDTIFFKQLVFVVWLLMFHFHSFQNSVWLLLGLNNLATLLRELQTVIACTHCHPQTFLLKLIIQVNYKNEVNYTSEFS